MRIQLPGVFVREIEFISLAYSSYLGPEPDAKVKLTRGLQSHLNRTVTQRH